MAELTHTSLYFVQEHKGRKPVHGGVGNTDIEQILQTSGFKPILFPYQDSFSMVAKIARFIRLFGLVLNFTNNAVIVFQFPLYARMNKILVKWASRRKKLFVICLIADIDGMKSGNNKLLLNERKELSDFHNFIVHNNAMQQWLCHFIVNPKIARLEFFDFLAQPFEGKRRKSFELAFAGNLSKSLFLENLDSLVKSNEYIVVNVYGEGITEKMHMQKIIRYKGIFAPPLLPGIIEGSFGLVWDGDGSFDQGDSLAHYMPYISHHKLSLYILSDLPIIVYAKAGSAELVEKYGIGITINCLDEIKQKIDAVSEENYQQMRRNMKPLARKIMTGGCLSEALATILKDII